MANPAVSYHLVFVLVTTFFTPLSFSVELRSKLDQLEEHNKE